MFKTFQQFLLTNPELPEVVEFDFEATNFVLPPSVAFLSNLTHWLCSIGCRVRFVGLNLERESIRYLDDSGFFLTHLGQRLTESSQCRDTTVPLKQLARRDSHAWLEHDFLPWLVEKSGLTKTSLAEIKACLQELINNISDHTAFEEGCIFGQWYPQKDQIIVSVADFGVGIPKTVERVEPGLSCSQAIVRAAEDGFSSKSLPTNRGAGLYILLLNVVIRFHGVVTIRSEDGYAKFANRSGKLHITKNNSCGYCIGTTIDIVLNTSKIPYAKEEEEQFQW